VDTGPNLSFQAVQKLCGIYHRHRVIMSSSQVTTAQHDTGLELHPTRSMRRLLCSVLRPIVLALLFARSARNRRSNVAT
jgi:hypothetical protein